MTEKFQTEAKVAKVDDALGIVFGWAIVSKQNGEDYYDTQDDHIPEDAMLKAATDFMANSRVAGDMHRQKDDRAEKRGTVVFAWPMTTEIAKSMGIETKTTGLMIGIKPDNDEILGKFRDGTYSGFSIGGSRLEDEEAA